MKHRYIMGLAMALCFGWTLRVQAMPITVIPKCGRAVGFLHKMTLTGPLDCTGGKAISLTGGELDCASHTIYGRENSSCTATNHASCTRMEQTPVNINHNGVVTGGRKTGSKISNCTIRGFDWGIVVKTPGVVITNTTTEYNVAYGANQTGQKSFGATWDDVQFQYNGDEGLHISDQYDWAAATCGGATSVDPNAPPVTKIINSSATDNGREGWYLLRACNMHLGLSTSSEDNNAASKGNTSARNGQHTSDGAHAGIYVKNSPSTNAIRYLSGTDNFMQIIGESDGNAFSDISWVNGYVRVQSAPPSTDNRDPNCDGAESSKCIVVNNVYVWPNSNTFTNICVDNSNASYSSRTKGYYFTGMTSGSNSFVGGQVKLYDASGKYAAYADDDSSGAHSTGNSVGVTTGTYVQPAALVSNSCHAETGNSFSTCSLQSSTPPSCH